MAPLSWQQVSAGLTFLSLLVITATLCVSYRVYQKRQMSSVRDAIRDVGERGLDRHLKVRPRIENYEGRLFRSPTTTVVFQFAERASTGGPGPTVLDENRADTSPWVPTNNPEFADPRNLKDRITRIDGVTAVDSGKTYGYTSKYVITVTCATGDPYRLREIVERVADEIYHEYARTQHEE